MNAVEDNSVLTKRAASGTICNSKRCPIGFGSPVWAFVLLSGLTILCYHRSLSGYFLADDLLHVAFLTEVFKGHPELLIQNFFSNWVQAQGTQFYRPIISLTLAADYLVWGANPFGFHLTNLFFEIASTFFLYLTCCRLFPSIPHPQRHLMAFGAAALFSVSPLHCEVASWIIARVDSVVTAFYLLACWLFLVAQQSQQNKRMLMSLSLASFALALMSKEMAVALPAVLTLCCLLGGVSATESGGGIVSRLKAAFIKTAPFWILLVVYFGVRVLALGTLLGGYQGSIGAGLTTSVSKRLTDGTFGKLLFPFNSFVFVGGNKIYGWLKILYGLCALSLAVALGRSIIERKTGLLRFLIFTVGWFVLALLPAIQVLNLADGLQGSRFVYLATAPLSLLFALMIFAPSESKSDTPVTTRPILANLIQVIPRLRICIFAFLVFCFVMTTSKNNTPWVHASRELRALRGALETELTNIPKDKSIALLNLPQTNRGAHIVYNGATFGVLLRPPLSPSDLSLRVATFEPVTYGYSDLVSLSRVKEMGATSNYYWYRWDRDSHSLVPLRIGRDTLSDLDEPTLDLPGGEFSLTGDQSLISPSFDRSPLSSDFINLDMSVSPFDGADEFQPASVALSWSTVSNPQFTYAKTLSVPITADGSRHTYRINLTEHKIWIESDRIVRMKLDVFPKPSKVKLYRTSLTSGKRSIPAISSLRGVDGVCQANPKLAFSYDASDIPGAVKVLYEISKPDYWFEHYSGTYRDAAPSKETLRSVTLDAVKGRVMFDGNDLGATGFFELRVAALDKDGKMIGYFSDPINFQFNK